MVPPGGTKNGPANTKANSNQPIFMAPKMAPQNMTIYAKIVSNLARLLLPNGNRHILSSRQHANSGAPPPSKAGQPFPLLPRCTCNKQKSSLLESAQELLQECETRPALESAVETVLTHAPGSGCKSIDTDGAP